MGDLLDFEFVGKRDVAVEQLDGPRWAVRLKDRSVLCAPTQRRPELLRLVTLAHRSDAVSGRHQTGHILCQVFQLRRAILYPREVHQNCLHNFLY